MSGTKPSTFCSLPWLHLASHPHGAVGVCCVSDHTNNMNMARSRGELLRLGRDSVSAIINSDYFREVRGQMLTGEVPAACRGCFKQEALGLKSKRQSETERYGLTEKEARRLTEADGRIRPDLKFVELRLGNSCNLKCRTCNPASSTKWRADYAALEQQLDFVRGYGGLDGFDWPERPEFWNQLAEVTPNLETLYINGGEPMLYKHHWDYLKKLVATGRAPAIELLYSSNVTTLPEAAFELWRHFKKVRVNASVDDLGERNRYIRHPADWNDIVSVLGRLKAAGVKVTILQTVSAMNVYYLDEFYAWAGREGFGVAQNLVFDPDYLSVAALPQKVRSRIFEKIAAGIGPERAGALKSLFDGPDDPEKWSRFLSYTRALDKLRGESFEKTFPELYDLLDPRESPRES